MGESTVGFVYFLQAVVGGPIKIGWALDPQENKRKISRGNWFRLRILATIEGGPPLERALHRQFDDLRLRGPEYRGCEWFEPAPKLKDWIHAHAKAWPKAPDPLQKMCAVCGVIFSPRNREQKTCGRDCHAILHAALPPACGRCGERGHGASGCAIPRVVTCSRCGDVGHRAPTCNGPGRQPRPWKKKKARPRLRGGSCIECGGQFVQTGRGRTAQRCPSCRGCGADSNSGEFTPRAKRTLQAAKAVLASRIGARQQGNGRGSQGVATPSKET